MGLLFGAFALLIGGLHVITWSICLTAAIVYFLTAITWLSPSHTWSDKDLEVHWKRVAQLEKELFGEVEKETRDVLAEYTKAAEQPPTGQP